jgi:hypothetical protein
MSDARITFNKTKRNCNHNDMYLLPLRYPPRYIVQPDPLRLAPTGGREYDDDLAAGNTGQAAANATPAVMTLSTPIFCIPA